MLSGAERQRRWRRHKLGDHTLCDPERGCDRSAQVEPPRPAVPEPLEKSKRYLPPEGYEHVRGPRGARLWEALSGQLAKQPVQLVLLDEACRMLDRLDRLDYVLADRSAWFTTETDDGGRVIVVVDAVLGEARQYAAAVRALLADISKALPKDVAERKGGLAGLADELAARRRAPAG